MPCRMQSTQHACIHAISPISCRFPGSEAAYNALIDCCDVRIVAEAAVFTSTEPSAANNAYNVSNGDAYRWSRVGVCSLSNLWQASSDLKGGSIVQCPRCTTANMFAADNKHCCNQGCTTSLSSLHAALHLPFRIPAAVVDRCNSNTLCLPGVTHSRCGRALQSTLGCRPHLPSNSAWQSS